MNSSLHVTCILLTTTCLAQPPLAPDAPMAQAASVPAMAAMGALEADTVVETLGFHTPGDGGGALYQVTEPADVARNGADTIALDGGLVAVLLEREAVNYRMFGARSDGESDDGVQIKLAHEYAIAHGIPVVNLSGDFWIKDTVAIPIQTNVSWGGTRLHIDERFNQRGQPRFVVTNDEPTKTLELTDELKTTLLDRVRPGVQLIPELADYAGHLVVVRDENDRIGVRAGYENHRGWAREDLFYVEEEGRILGEVAWTFEDFTSIDAIPCPRNYLVIEGGSIYVSGDTPESGSEGYHQNGFSIGRSRTIIRNQWVGLEPGRSDDSLEPRSGFYTLSGVFDVTLENIRAMPWEKNRPEGEIDVAHGTYGIGGARMLNCTFRNLTAEAGWVSWGVFGTNLNKNLRIENCRLNRVDVHFHCWGLTIKDSEIGFKGITLTGGGDLLIENTTRHGNSFIDFRPDYGSKWDGPIRLSNCTLRPVSGGTVVVLSYGMRDFDYQYPIGFARSIEIEDLLIDYAAAPDSQAPAWLIYGPPFSRTDSGQRLFFPSSIRLRDIRVAGREQGVRLMRIPDPYGYRLDRPGGFDGALLTPNCDIDVERVQLERLAPSTSHDTDQVHFLVGGSEAGSYADAYALYPRIRFRDCDGTRVYAGNVAGSLFLRDCSVSGVIAPGLRGDLVLDGCRLRPQFDSLDGQPYVLDAELGARLTSCTIHGPVVGGESRPDLIGALGLLELNGTVSHSHLSTTLGNDVLAYCAQEGIELTPEFLDRLMLHQPVPRAP